MISSSQSEFDKRDWFLKDLTLHIPMPESLLKTMKEAMKNITIFKKFAVHGSDFETLSRFLIISHCEIVFEKLLTNQKLIFTYLIKILLLTLTWATWEELETPFSTVTNHNSQRRCYFKLNIISTGFAELLFFTKSPKQNSYKA